MKPHNMTQGKTPADLGMPIKTISIDLTEGCSLRCTYCFADIGSPGKKTTKLSYNTGTDIIDWFLKDSTSGKGTSDHLNIEWWGGEPFTEFPLMKGLTEYAKNKAKELNKKIMFGGTTNIVSLNKEKIQWMIDNDIYFLLSCDGRGRRNKERKLPCGENSWYLVEKKLNRLKSMYNKAEKKLPQIRMTIGPSNIEGMTDDLIYFDGQGFKGVFYSENFDVKWTKKDLSMFEGELKKLSTHRIETLKNNELMKSKFLDDMSGSILENSMVDDKTACNSNGWSCGSGKSYVGVSVEGAIYPCHRFNKHNTLEKFWNEKLNCLGSIYEGITNIEFYGEIKDLKIPSLHGKSPLAHCSGCEVELACMGGCMAVAKDNTSSISGKVPSICSIKKMLYRVALEEINSVVRNGLLGRYCKKLNIQIAIPQILRNRNKNKACTCFMSSYDNASEHYIAMLTKGKLADNLEPGESDKLYLLDMVSKIAAKQIQKVVQNKKFNLGCLCNNGIFNRDASIDAIGSLDGTQVIELVKLFNSYIQEEYNG